MKTVTAEDLNNHLIQNKQVTVEDLGGAKFTFEIVNVSPMFWDPERSWYSKTLADNEESFKKALTESVAKPSPEVLRAVVMAGVLSPKIVENPKDGEVGIGDLERRDVMYRLLYAQIASHTFDRILKIGGGKGGVRT